MTARELLLLPVQFSHSFLHSLQGDGFDLIPEAGDLRRQEDLTGRVRMDVIANRSHGGRPWNLEIVRFDEEPVMIVQVWRDNFSGGRDSGERFVLDAFAYAEMVRHLDPQAKVRPVEIDELGLDRDLPELTSFGGHDLSEQPIGEPPAGNQMASLYDELTAE